MASFEIGNKRVGDGERTYFVAELSANHGQKLERALQAVDAAAQAGADAIKLQTYTPDTLTLKSDAPPFVVKTKNEWAGRTLHDLYAEAMTPWEWHQPLFERARALGLACFSTPFDETAVQFLADLGVPAWKVASFELTDLPLVEAIARQGQPVILSTGMATLGEIEAAVSTCFQAGNRQVAVLRCVSAYPADPASMDLRSMELLKQLGVVIGLSDHTVDNTAAVAAVTLGARFIEKHFIVDRSWGGPDAFFSLEPEQFKRLVAEVRVCEAALGKTRFGPGPEEQSSLAFRRSLFVARDVPAGAVLTCDDVRSVRPSNGLPAAMLPEVLGRTASRALRATEPLTLDSLGPRPALPPIVLRRARADDTNRLLEWRNDPLTRQYSRNAGGVTPSEHEQWLKNTLASRTRVLCIAEVEGRAAGQVRLDVSGSLAEVSITVAPEFRGKGMASAMLTSVETIAREQGVVTLTAEIQPGNDASIRAFKRAGYAHFVTQPKRGLLRCDRRIARFPT